MSESIRSHKFTDSREAYDASQTSDAIRDGDVLVVPDGVAVLVEAWPVVFSTGRPDHVFHHLEEGVEWRTFKDGRYYNSAVVALALYTVEGMIAAGLGTQKPLLDIARSHGWVGEFPSQERLTPERDDSWGAG